MTDLVALHRVPGATQHAMMRRRTGTQLSQSMGPASAEQRFTLHRVQDTGFVS
jgi:hypothetical protein